VGYIEESLEADCMRGYAHFARKVSIMALRLVVLLMSVVFSTFFQLRLLHVFRF
jgi:hypothetical protein